MRMIVRTLGLGAALAVAAACASVGPPPGGPEDKAPPQILSLSIDTNATSVTSGKLEVIFDEVISERPSVPGAAGGGPVTLDAVVLMSPRTGSAKVSWHRERITIEPRGGFRPNTTYRVTLMPGIADIRGNVSSAATSIVFSTGPSVLPFSIVGRVFNWEANTVAPGAFVEAIANAGTADSLIHVTVADSAGRFEVGPLGPGQYLVRSFIDTDYNRALGVVERWDTTTVTVTDHRPSIELRAIQRDTAPIGVQRIEVLDSTWVRVLLDKPFDSRTTLQPALATLRQSDSTELAIAAVMTDAQAAFVRPQRDSTRRDSTSVTPPIQPPTGAADGVRPSFPPPERAVVIRLAPGVVLRPGQRYALTLRGLRNLVGRSEPIRVEFDAPRPAGR